MTYTTKIIDGVSVPLSAAEIAELDARDAAWAAGKPARDKAAANAAILAEIAAIELLALRPMRELRRAREHGDVPAADAAFAGRRLKVLDDAIAALRARLRP